MGKERKRLKMQADQERQRAKQAQQQLAETQASVQSLEQERAAAQEAERQLAEAQASLKRLEEELKVEKVTGLTHSMPCEACLSSSQELCTVTKNTLCCMHKVEGHSWIA